MTTTTLTRRPTTLDTAQPGFMAGAIPSDVRSAAGVKNGAADFDKNAVAFSMGQGNQKADMVWDKTADALYVKKDGAYALASDDVKNAVVARLSQKDLAATRQGSRYDGLRDDVLETKSGSTSVRKNPEMPKSDVDREALYVGLLGTVEVKAEQEPLTTTDAQVSSTITPRPLEKLPTKPESKPVATTESKPVATTESKPVVKPESKPVVAAESKPVVTTETKPVVTTETKPVVKPVVAYSKADLERVQGYLEDGTVTKPAEPRLLTAQECAKKGLPKGTSMIELHPGGNSDTGTLAIYCTKDGRMFKELNDAFDGRNTPVVALTERERVSLEKNFSVSNDLRSDATDSNDSRYQLMRNVGLAGH